MDWKRNIIESKIYLYNIEKINKYMHVYWTDINRNFTEHNRVITLFCHTNMY